MASSCANIGLCHVVVPRIQKYLFGLNNIVIVSTLKLFSVTDWFFEGRRILREYVLWHSEYLGGPEHFSDFLHQPWHCSTIVSWNKFIFCASAITYCSIYLFLLFFNYYFNLNTVQEMQRVRIPNEFANLC